MFQFITRLFTRRTRTMSELPIRSTVDPTPRGWDVWDGK